MKLPTIMLCNDRDDAAKTALTCAAAAAKAAVDERGRFRLALAGGSTPRALYELMADHADSIPWADVTLYWGDERCVPPDDEHSNYRMVKEALLDHVVPGAVHRIEGELAPERAATRYGETIDEPIDLVLLGMGGDGHTASLFPNDPSLDTSAPVVATKSPVAPHDRVSLSLSTINRARQVMVLVTGASKAERLAQAYDELEHDAATLPIAMVQPSGTYLWILDEEAAAKLQGRV